MRKTKSAQGKQNLFKVENLAKNRNLRNRNLVKERHLSEEENILNGTFLFEGWGVGVDQCICVYEFLCSFFMCVGVCA